MVEDELEGVRSGGRVGEIPDGQVTGELCRGKVGGHVGLLAKSSDGDSKPPSPWALPHGGSADSALETWRSPTPAAPFGGQGAGKSARDRYDGHARTIAGPRPRVSLFPPGSPRLTDERHLVPADW
ncbi:hypothetical protein GCM10010246_04880 [Streptomyces cuspidosporus]|uniref:Uncharacterized protein n=1 Tax=Streptomyces cuspidosporus TaxID=66882 RepID=A0ABP5S802_9ACTN